MARQRPAGYLPPSFYKLFQSLHIAGEDLLAEITDGDAGGGGGVVSEEGDGDKEEAAAVDEQRDDKDVTKTETLCYDQVVPSS